MTTAPPPDRATAAVAFLIYAAIVLGVFTALAAIADYLEGRLTDGEDLQRPFDHERD